MQSSSVKVLSPGEKLTERDVAVEGRLFADWDGYWKGFMTIGPLERMRRFVVIRTVDCLMRKFGRKGPFHFCELGAGTGVISRHLGTRFGADISIVDSNRKAIQICQETFRGFPKNFRTIEKDVFDLKEYEGQFDLVHSGGLIEHFVGPAREQILDIHCSLAKQEGYLLILVPVVNFWYRVLNLGILKWFHLLEDIHEVPWTVKEVTLALQKRGFRILAKKSVINEIGILAKRF